MKFANDSDMANKCVDAVRVMGRRSRSSEVVEYLEKQGYEIKVWSVSHLLQDDPRIKTEEVGHQYLFTVRDSK